METVIESAGCRTGRLMRPAVVLLSGGQDSATCLAWARAEGFATHALTVAYGQRHGIEVARATEIARRLGAAVHRVVPLDLSFLAGSALTDPRVDVPKQLHDEPIAAGIPSPRPGPQHPLSRWRSRRRSRWVARTSSSGHAIDYSGHQTAGLNSSARLKLWHGSTKAGTTWRVHAARRGHGEIVRRAVALGVPSS
jgi:7-cyano-7-deazaguanine synthase